MNIKILLNRIQKIRLLLASPYKRARIMKNKFYYCGENVVLHTTEFGTEPYLISIHDNVHCAANVRFITHDGSCYRIADYLNISHNEVDSIGSIELFENCFVGACSILMPGCSVGKNSVIAAGSVVTKKVPDGEIWGGVPAKFMMTLEDYSEKVIKKSKKYPWVNQQHKMSDIDLIKMRQTYFFGNFNTGK